MSAYKNLCRSYWQANRIMLYNNWNWFLCTVQFGQLMVFSSCRFAALHTLLAMYVGSGITMLTTLLFQDQFKNEPGSSGGIDIPTNLEDQNVRSAWKHRLGASRRFCIAIHTEGGIERKVFTRNFYCVQGWHQQSEDSTAGSVEPDLFTRSFCRRLFSVLASRIPVWQQSFSIHRPPPMRSKDTCD